MKTLTPALQIGSVQFPEDGVDRRTAASIEGAVQQLFNRLWLMEQVYSKGVVTPIIPTPNTVNLSLIANNLSALNTHVVDGVNNLYYDRATRAHRRLVPSTVKSGAPFGLSITPAGRIWAIVANNGSEIGYSDNWGVTWQTVPLVASPPSTLTVYGVDVSDDGNTIVAVVHYTDGTARTYRSTNGGASFTLMTSSGSPQRIYIAPDGRLWGISGTAIMTSLNGSSWQTVTPPAGVSPSPDRAFKRNGNLYFPAANRLVRATSTGSVVVDAVAPYGENATPPAFPYMTTDGQLLWIASPSLSSALSGPVIIMDANGRILSAIPENASGTSSAQQRTWMIANGIWVFGSLTLPL